MRWRPSSTPQSQERRLARRYRGYARRKEEEVLEKAKEVRKEISHSVDEAKRFLKETEATIAAALAAGKEAFKKEKGEKT